MSTAVIYTIIFLFLGNSSDFSSIIRVQTVKIVLFSIPSILQSRNEVWVAAEENESKRLVFVRLEKNKKWKDRGFKIRFFQNGDQRFRIKKPKGYTVLAVRLVLDFESRRGREFSSVVLVPYSENLDFPEIREFGKRQLVLDAFEARRELRRSNVQSRAFNGTLVADLVPLEIPLSLTITEHADAKNHQLTFERFLYFIGWNGWDAYRYSSSCADAKGLSQFKEKTYLGLVRLYPEAKLPPEFYDGIASHVNMIKAQFLLADEILAQLPQRVRKDIRVKPEVLRKYIAAAYNAGNAARAGLTRKNLHQFEKNLQPSVRHYVRKFSNSYQYAMAMHPR